MGDQLLPGTTSQEEIRDVRRYLRYALAAGGAAIALSIGMKILQDPAETTTPVEHVQRGNGDVIASPPEDHQDPAEIVSLVGSSIAATAAFSYGVTYLREALENIFNDESPTI